MKESETSVRRKIVIVGGGFGGIRCALDLVKHVPVGTRVQLISNKKYFEYYAALYRVVTGDEPADVYIPLSDIFSGTFVEVLHDTVTSIDIEKKIVFGQSGAHYQADYIVLALGSETSYFNIKGLKEQSFGFKTTNEAIRLKRHIDTLFKKHRYSAPEEQLLAFHFVIIGAGASGVELAGELEFYTRQRAKCYNINKSLISIDLIAFCTMAISSAFGTRRPR